MKWVKDIFPDLSKMIPSKETDIISTKNRDYSKSAASLRPLDPFAPPSPQTSYSPLRLQTGNTKNENVKLMHKPLIQTSCLQIKNKMKSEEIQ